LKIAIYATNFESYVYLGVLFFIILALLGKFTYVLTGVFTGGGEWESRHNYYDIKLGKALQAIVPQARCGGAGESLDLMRFVRVVWTQHFLLA
jgi:hypothetical protein